jgi:hypothetical protein
VTFVIKTVAEMRHLADLRSNATGSGIQTHIQFILYQIPRMTAKAAYRRAAALSQVPDRNQILNIKWLPILGTAGQAVYADCMD